ncbi:MAG: hypothetical protein NZO58_07655 [Gemmataceae bacterium]|nr:hypothetical protein [Gemmataceae bacterium]
MCHDLFRPCHWYVGPSLSVAFETEVAEDVPWEVYQGRLLMPEHARQRRRFTAWNLVQQTDAGPADLPLVSLKFDSAARMIHVVRGILSYVWQNQREETHIVAGTEVPRWVAELVGSVGVLEVDDLDELRDQLTCLLWQAVVGTSRLPLTSLEAPLPAFVFGQLTYLYRPAATDNQPLTDWRQLIELGWQSELGQGESAKLLELILRAARPAELPDTSQRIVSRWRVLGRSPAELRQLLQVVFNDVSLSPWTNFVPNCLALLRGLVAHGVWTTADEIDFLAWLLQKLCRHLTAYDLVTFHHRGANYPDALLLDAALKRYLQLLGAEPGSEEGAGPARRRRRALRQALLARHAYHGHAVPDAPTSPGENIRVLPAPWGRVDDEQVWHPQRRRKFLFAEEPLAKLLGLGHRRAFGRSLDDLAHREELLELGLATFIDRPFGVGKERLEPDQTPLLAHEAFSPRIAQRNLDRLASLAAELGVPLPSAWESWQRDLEEAAEWVPGVPILAVASLERPVAALADARRASDDFIVLRTLPGSRRLLRTCFDWSVLERRFQLQRLWSGATFRCLRLVCGTDQSVVVISADVDAGRGAQSGPRLLLEADPGLGYRNRGGLELPVAGLRIWAVRDDNGADHDLRGEEVRVLPRW